MTVRVTRGSRGWSAPGRVIGIATWAHAYTPGELTEEQERLLGGPVEKEISEVQRRAEQLGSYRASPLWPLLAQEEQALVQSPSAHPQLPDASYPLPIGQLRTLTGASLDQIRHWDELGLLHFSRSQGGHRQFFADAAMRAFAYKRTLNQAQVTVLRSLTQPDGAQMMRCIAAVLFDQASVAGPDDQRLFKRAAESLQEVSVVVGHRHRS